jgi:hypothetical protein
MEPPTGEVGKPFRSIAHMRLIALSVMGIPAMPLARTAEVVE